MKIIFIIILILIVLAVVMIIIGINANITPPILTGIGFIIIAYLFYKRN